MVSGSRAESGLRSIRTVPMRTLARSVATFPGFGGAYDTWKHNDNSFNEQVLKQEAQKVVSALPNAVQSLRRLLRP